MSPLLSSMNSSKNDDSFHSQTSTISTLTRPSIACPACNRLYTRKFSLRSHVEKKHPGLVLPPNLQQSYRRVSCGSGKTQEEKRKAHREYQRRYVRRNPQSRSLTNAKYNQKVRQRLKQQQSVVALPKTVSVVQSLRRSSLTSWSALTNMHEQALEKSAFSLVEQDPCLLDRIKCPSFVLVRPKPLYPGSRKNLTTNSFQ